MKTLFIICVIAVIVYYFIKKGNPKAALIKAILEGDVSKVKIICSKGLDLNFLIKYDPECRPSNPLLIAITSDNVQCKKNRKALVETLLQSGADGNMKGGNGSIPFLRGLLKGELKELHGTFVKGLSDINSQDPSDRMTPLHYIACGKCDKNLAFELIQRGANINAQDESGDTPLHITTHTTDYDLAEALVSKGANVNITNQNGHTPLQEIIGIYKGKSVQEQWYKNFVSLLNRRG